MKSARALTVAVAALVAMASRAADDARFAPAQIEAGRAIYSQNCAACHGPRMADPGSAFDLRTFPPDQHARFVNSVTNGKNNMPPWGDLFNEAEIEALWAYVRAGETR
jgi:mono/diheme cytochrome c family protein